MPDDPVVIPTVISNPPAAQMPSTSEAWHRLEVDVGVLKASAEAEARQSLRKAVASAEQAARDAEQAVHDRADELKAHVENSLRAAAVRVEAVLAGRASHVATAFVAALAGSGLLAWGLLAFLGAKALGL